MRIVKALRYGGLVVDVATWTQEGSGSSLKSDSKRWLYVRSTLKNANLCSIYAHNRTIQRIHRKIMYENCRETTDLSTLVTAYLT